MFLKFSFLSQSYNESVASTFGFTTNGYNINRFAYIIENIM